MERADHKLGRRAVHEVWIGNELIRNAPRDPIEISLMIRERRCRLPAQKARDRMAASLKERGLKA
ncbi:hypothetical protein RCCGE510_07201 [Rhizobium sp. CCGE 510]|nr:hypothetical protein RCCGE510_07201 [Rhizobium sp. CCGE 510]